MPIRDLSFFDAEDIKQRNTVFLESDSPYDILEHQTRYSVRADIWRVRNGDLRKLFYRFPFNEDVLEQCALWMHAMTGKHFFPDANHRTGIMTLRKILRENNYRPTNWPTLRTQAAIQRSKETRRSLSVNLGNLYEKDPLYEIWELYFYDVLELPTTDGEP